MPAVNPNFLSTQNKDDGKLHFTYCLSALDQQCDEFLAVTGMADVLCRADAIQRAIARTAKRKAKPKAKSKAKRFKFSSLKHTTD